MAFRQELSAFDDALVDKEEMERDSTTARELVKAAADARFSSWKNQSATIAGMAGLDDFHLVYPPVFIASIPAAYDDKEMEDYYPAY